MGLYDSATNESLFCDKVLHISQTCKVRYSSAKRGRIAQINSLREDGGPGSQVHYHVCEYTPVSLAEDEVFKRFARNIDLEPMELAIKIIANS